MSKNKYLLPSHSSGYEKRKKNFGDLIDTFAEAKARKKQFP